MHELSSSTFVALFLSLSFVMCGCGTETEDMYEECGGAYDAATFEVKVRYIQASPLDPSENWVTNQAYETWDWDGQIPDNWLEASTKIAEFLGELADTIPEPHLAQLADAAEYTQKIAEFTDEWAPVLLEDYATPDLFLTSNIESPDVHDGTIQSLDFYYPPSSTAGVDLAVMTGEVITPDSNETELDANLLVPFYSDDDVMTLDVYDEDLLTDDWVGGFVFSKEALLGLSGCGLTLLTSDRPEETGLWGLVVDVSAYLDEIEYTTE